MEFKVVKLWEMIFMRNGNVCCIIMYMNKYFCDFFFRSVNILWIGGVLMVMNIVFSFEREYLVLNWGFLSV